MFFLLSRMVCVLENFFFFLWGGGGGYHASNAVSDFLCLILPHMDIGHAVTVVNFYVMITIFCMWRRVGRYVSDETAACLVPNALDDDMSQWYVNDVRLVKLKA